MFSPQHHHHHRQQPQEEEEEEEQQTSFLGFCSFCVELVGGTSKKQNWKGLAIAFVVIAIICLFIAGATFLATKQKIPIHNELLSISEKDIYNIKLPQPWNGTWISNKYFSYLDMNNSIWIYNCDILKGELLFKKDLIQQEFIDHGMVSPSTRYLLLPIRKGKIRPYYTEYQYDIYEKTKMIGSITFSDQQKIPVSAVLYSHSDNLFTFIHQFDIYVRDIPKKINYRVTSDGNRDTIHNGLVEWIYEYEIFNRNILLFWSPTDRYLAYIKIDLTNLSKNHYLKYDMSADENEEKYSIPYPKYNQSLPFLEVYIYDIKTGKTLPVPRPIENDRSKKSSVYIYHIIWYSETGFSVVYGNRQQNSSIIQLYDISNDRISLKSKYLEETRKGFLFPRFLKPFFFSNGTYVYIIRYEQFNLEKSKQKSFPYVVRIHFNQSYPQIDAKSPRNIKVDEIIHVDHFGQVYLTGSRRNESLERQFYRWNLVDMECLSCNQSCGYANAQFSLENGSYYILECFGPSIPYSTLHNRREKLALINDNQQFREWTEKRLMPYIDYFTVPLDTKNTVGNGMIILPPNYSPNRTIASYPVIVTINDRLYDQRVTNKYILPLAEFVQVIQDNISIVIFDSHGSTGQDENYFKNNYQDWLSRQYEDYIKLAQHLKWNETKFNGTLNDTRFGLKAQGPAAVIALKLLEESNEYVCAFLQSPVNDLSHYHAIFSERINGLEVDIKSGRNSRENIGNKSLAIVHGTADEVVHFKHSATLVKSLANANIQFDFKVYPDVDHYFEQDPKIYNDFLFYQRQFFQERLGGRINKIRKIFIPEEEHY